MERRYNDEMVVYREKKTAMVKIQDHIQTTVAQNLIVHLLKKKGVHEMLRALKERVAPTNRAREIDIAMSYNRLKRFNRNQGLETWLQD